MEYNSEPNLCSSLQPYQYVCCSPGTLPDFQPQPNPDLSTLNPCLLNACCDVWGQCGTTAEFCTNTSTGAPGTATPGTNGCISNCGTNIVRSSPLTTFMNVTYFEGYNLGQPCLYMDVSQLGTLEYTHVHFAFATLTPDYQVVIGDVLTTYEFNVFQ